MYLQPLVKNLCLFFLVLSFNATVFAQADKATEKPQKPLLSLKNNTEPAALPPSVERKKSGQKMLQEATINLQTTVTGNQEQPKVLYILPWQSPASDDVDFEMLQQQPQTVFGHIEREELRRELESINEQ